MPIPSNGSMSAAIATIDTPKMVAILGLLALGLLVLIAHGFRPVS
jgi:hypothetical protein